MPAFEEVEAEVRAELIAEQRARSKEKAFAAMRARYTVVMPEEDTRQASVGSAAKGEP